MLKSFSLHAREREESIDIMENDIINFIIEYNPSLKNLFKPPRNLCKLQHDNEVAILYSFFSAYY